MTPETAFNLTTSIESIVLVMFGGIGTVVGPIIGAVAYGRLSGSLLTSDTFHDLHVLVGGALLLVIVLFATGGLVGVLRGRSQFLRQVLE